MSRLNRGAIRRWWPLAVGVLLGLLAGVLLSLLGSGTRRAEASVLISSPAGPAAVRPMLPNLRELATSGVVAANVRSTLRLKQSTQQVRRHLHATVRPKSEVIAVSATDELADHARQVAQETALVFAQLVDARFGTGEPTLHAAVLDSAHVLDGPDRHFVRNGLIGALVGVLLGSAAMFVLASGTRPVVAPVVADDEDLRMRESLLEQRVKGVTARERALADRAGKLAAREQELEAREQDLDERAARKPEPEPLPAAPSLPAPEPEPAPEPVLAPEPEPEPALPTRTATWKLSDIQRAVDEHIGSATPEQAESWRTYLYFIREHASPDGTLPRSLDPLIADVFAEVLR